MQARIQKALAKRQAGEGGFTLIELLVVIVIIGILAAIAIPAFLNQREKAWQKAVESDLRNAAIAAESFGVSNGGDYTGVALTDLEDEGFTSSDDVTISVTSADATGFVLSG